MTPRIYQLQSGYEILTSDGLLFTVNGKVVKPCGKVGSSWKGSGRLVNGVPNHIKETFFKLQRRE